MKPKALVKTILDNKITVPVTDTGIVGDGAGNVEVEGQPGYVWVRINDRPVPVLCTVPVANDLPVICGVDVNQPNSAYQVLRARHIAFGNAEAAPSTVVTASRFRYNFPGGGQDPLFVELRQFMPLRPGPLENMTIEIHRGFVLTAENGFLLVDYDTLDMTPHRPTTAGQAAWVLITVDNEGTIVETKGTEVSLSSLPYTAFPAIPDGTSAVICAIRVYHGQTVVQDARSNTDIVDLRFTGYGGGSAPAPAIEEGPGIDLVTTLTGVQAGVGLDSILVEHADGSPATEYARSNAGLAAAIAAYTYQDVFHLPAFAFTGDFSFPYGAIVKGAPGFTQLNGATAAAGGNYFENLHFYNSSSNPAVAPVAFLPAGSAFLYRCRLEAVQNGTTGAAHAMYDGWDVYHFGCWFYAFVNGAHVNPFGSSDPGWKEGGYSFGSWFIPEAWDAVNSYGDSLGQMSYISHAHKIQETMQIAGTLTTGAKPFRLYNASGVNRQIVKVFLSVGTAPDGAALIVDLHKNGTTIFTNQANRPQVAAGASTGETITVDDANWAAGQYLTVEVDQIGSSTPGADLTVHILYLVFG